MYEPNRNSRKRLRFSEYSSLILTEPKSSEEVQDTWYTQKELAIFKKNVRLASQALRHTRTSKIMKYIAHSAATGSPKANIIVHNKEAILGIEHLISLEVLKMLIETRARHRTRVLQVQQVDPSNTATVSEINSTFSKEWSSRLSHFQCA
mmetsp:Transcript_1380/g.2895  ORF Transcript_1380/g.2895 Transcript_1380/m.2895 type:complete len:150 (+) Transcript_1380:122-571(+)|eukprot:CAMPEP_0172311052 /NCGR_PEP_ID=MMETSP1058-20130122/13656_1 /TAXON_ID=83371 /ORGANISM="Detonula confervacea, Strain CCMP 353" /LENGTH=149 /DNA_ID=CAMNT_0013024109 /DNA_START=48 /DNA_END=497 /DNA_ORIENTATION=-